MDTKRLRFQTIIPLQKYSLILKSDSEKIIEAVSCWVDADIAGRHSADALSPRVPVEVDLYSGLPPAGVEMPSSPAPTAVFEDVKFYLDSDYTALTFDDKSFVNVDLKKGIARGFVCKEHLEAPWTISHRIFYVPVLEMMRAKGVCYIHAGCVCRGNQSILLSGGSGHGKSTLTYALARSRFSYLSDDAVFVENGPAGIEIFSFPEKIKLDTNSRSFFPEFDEFEKSRGKMEIPLKSSRISDVVVRGEPYAVIFCGIGHGKESKLAGLPRSETLLRLIGQSVSIASKKSIERNLDMLMALSEASRSYELKVGNTFEGVPELIESALFAQPQTGGERPGS